MALFRMATSHTQWVNMTTVKRLSALLGGLGLLLWAAPSQALRPLIEIEGAQFRPLPVAIPDFSPQGAVSTGLDVELAEILRQDLALSGLFQVLDKRSFLASPQQEGVTVGSINFPAWLNVGADGLIKVQLGQKAGQLQADLYIYDVARGREVFHKPFQGSQQAKRALVHRLADQVIEYYTGESGLFQSRIAFARRSGKNKDICIMDVDGFNAKCVVQNGSLNILPNWAGTNHLLFTSYLKGSTDLYQVNLANGQVSVISKRQGLNSGASMSPDGKSIALTLSQDGNSEIYVLDRDGKKPRRLTYDTFAIDSSPSWSPDGKQIAFVSDRAGSPQIYVMNIDGSGVRRLTFQGNYNQTPAWSPRGDRIAFTARDERNVFDIFTVAVDGGKITRITQDQGNNEEPTWAPNGRMLAFISNRAGPKAIFISDADGRVQKRISKIKSNCFTPRWSPQKTSEPAAKPVSH